MVSKGNRNIIDILLPLFPLLLSFPPSPPLSSLLTDAPAAVGPLLFSPGFAGITP